MLSPDCICTALSPRSSRRRAAHGSNVNVKHRFKFATESSCFKVHVDCMTLARLAGSSPCEPALYCFQHIPSSACSKFGDDHGRSACMLHIKLHSCPNPGSLGIRFIRIQQHLFGDIRAVAKSTAVPLCIESCIQHLVQGLLGPSSAVRSRADCTLLRRQR